jgi:hypothetical protein
MKLRLLTLAAGLVAASGAHALTPSEVAAARTAGTIKEISISGASALRLSLAAYVQEICAPGSLHVYFNGTLPVTSSSGNNHRAYACNLAADVKTAGNGYAAGTPVVIYKRDQGGSAQGVNPIALNTAIAHLKLVDDSSCAVTPNPTFTDIQIPNYLCSGTENRVSDAGISDVEPGMLNQQPNLPDVTAGDPASGTVAPVDLTNVVSNPFVQGIFGVAVNKQAYFALQRTQFPTETTGKTIADIDSLPQPSLPTTFVRAMLTGGLSASTTSKRGWGLVISESVDASVNTKAFNVCRRQPGSGTQAASNIYFAQNPCAADVSNILRQTSATQPAPAVTISGGYNVREESGTGGVETCLGGSPTVTGVESVSGAYGIAVLGRENNPRANGGDKGYRYVKLDGAAPLRYDATTGKGAITGDYDFVFESTLQYNSTNPNLNADKIGFIGAIRTGAAKPSAIAAADADTREGVMAPFGSWSPAQYPALNATDKQYASRVARTAGNSCTVLKLAR